MTVQKIISKVFSGILKGFALSMIIPLLISVIKGDGNFHSVSPDLILVVGNEINAVVMQIVMCVLLEIIFQFSNYIWQIERLNIILQSLVDFLIRYISFFGCLIVCHWYSANYFFNTVLVSIFIFIVLYILIAFFKIKLYKIKIKKINEKLSASV